ncbi:BolA family transcriptional regulator [Cupriavidus sp. AU9028]|uniref:BolA family protein n=1 Tax=Cupriavidus sp. AU9028 TaxID=2871157 RepID=UPI001C94D7BD|nr:BolA family protein [Cupriavidus sp. AU9028]MBY4897500.1 BolA family transcriptional regulator [Cupriavidus sp. AU9028]
MTDSSQTTAPTAVDPAAPVAQQIEALLRAALAPGELAVRDDSGLHAGHPGAAGGGGHYHVTIVSERFAGLNRVARHRMVYDALRCLFPERIHALAVAAYTSAERSER